MSTISQQITPVNAIDVSVVMGVFNGGRELAESLESVLAQGGVTLELIVVDDGSTDDSGRLLDEAARRDSRVRVIHQKNIGLTGALITGCAVARGRYLARQDVGDISLPGKLTRQCGILDGDPQLAMTSCGTRFIGPAGELLYEVVQRGDELERGLEQEEVGRLTGPSSHPSVVLRRSVYEACGGYRPAFRVAQDLDLWVRVAERGRCLATPEIGYEAAWQLGSISHLRRRQQVLAKNAIIACRERRRLGQSEDPVLARLAFRLDKPALRVAAPKGMTDARLHYFLGSLLERRDPVAARRYLGQAVRNWPLHLKAWVKLARLELISNVA